MAAANALASIFALLYQVSMAKLLSPHEFGTLASLLAVFVILAVTAPAFQLAAAKFAATTRTNDQHDQLRAYWLHLLRRSFLLGIVATMALLALIPVLKWLLQIESIGLVVLLAISFLFAFAYPVNMGILQGMQRFKALAAAMIATPLLRFSLGSLLVVLGFGVHGAFLPYMVGFIVVFFAIFATLRHFPRAVVQHPKTGIDAYMGWTALTYAAFVALANVDVILVKHYLDPIGAGEYAALSVLGRIVLFAPVGVTFVLFAKSAGGDLSSKRRLGLLAGSLAYTFLATGAVVLAFQLVPDIAVNILVGDQYGAIIPFLVNYGIGMVGISATFLLMHYYLSISRTRVALPILAGVVVQIVLVVAYHDNVSQLAFVRLIAGVFTLVAVVAYGMFGDVFCFLKTSRIDHSSSRE
jgi:O-antigen/teichoic acid export membrane protein